MSLLDNTKNQIQNIAKTLLHPSNISYGFIGLTTALLGYYTFFENNIENPLPDTLASTPESITTSPESTASPSESIASSLNPFASSPESPTESTASSLNPFASSPASSPSESIASSLNPFASSDKKPIISGGKKYKTKKITKKKK